MHPIMARSNVLAAFSALVVTALATAGEPKAADAVAEIEAGNVYVTVDGVRRQLTSMGRDSDPLLTPDGKAVLFTRHAAAPADADAPPEGCAVPADELRRIGVDGSGEALVLAGRRGDAPERMLCGFLRKQFASDGRTLYFLAPAWATSAALHALDTVTGVERFVLPANDVLVLSTCTLPEYRDHLVVQQHRYYVFGGSYDWYWVFDPAGKRELGPVGEADSIDIVVQKIEDSGSCR